MRADFPKFRWCENDWKVQGFATEKYPDWVKDVRKSEKARLTHTILILFPSIIFYNSQNIQVQIRP